MSTTMGDHANAFIKLANQWSQGRTPLAGFDMECFGALVRREEEEKYRLVWQMGWALGILPADARNPLLNVYKHAAAEGHPCLSLMELVTRITLPLDLRNGQDPRDTQVSHPRD
jgi:hypothetical protein